MPFLPLNVANRHVFIFLSLCSDADGGNDASDIACSSPASLGDLNGSRVINIQDMVTLVQVSEAVSLILCM